MSSYEGGLHRQGQQIRPRSWDVFISYAREDSKIAQLLTEALGNRGFSVWLDTELKAGEPLQAVERAINSSGAVIALLSAASLSSRWLRREVDIALRALPAQYVVPIAVGDVDVRNLPSWLTDRHWLHLRDGRQVEELADRLLPSLEAALGDRDSATSKSPRIVGHVPPRVPLVGVDEYLRELRSQRTGVTWIVGIPGIGKTNLAREYAFQVRNEVSFIYWVSGMRLGANALASEIEEQLRLVENGSSEPGRRGGGLVIVDELDAVSDNVRELLSYVATLGTRHRVLITARRLPDSQLMRQDDYSVIVVGPLSRAGTAEYLDIIAPPIPPREREALERIAQSTGGSPLLLRLAVELLQRRPLDEVFSETPTPEAVIDSTLDALMRELSDNERRRLHVISFCAGLLTTIRTHEQWTLPGDEALFAQLLAWGLCTERGGHTSFAHRAIPESLCRNAPREALEDAIAYVTAHLPDPADAEAGQLLASVVALSELSELGWNQDVSANLAELLIWQASVWRSDSEPARAEQLCTRALLLAAESRKTPLQIRAMNLQSALAYDQGRIAEASSIERRTADLARSELGPDHPISIASLANLAISLRALGELPEAITLLRQVVERSREVLPSGHPDLIAAFGNLAICLRAAGLFGEAMQLLRMAIDQSSNDRSRLQLDQILAALMTDVGRLDEAAAVLTDALARAEGRGITRQSDALTTRANLATVHARQGRLSEALSLQSEVVSGFEVLHGPDHPSTLSARNNYAVLLSETGAPTEALQIFADVTTDRARVLGENHPETLQSRVQVARAMRDCGDDEGALQIYSGLLAKIVRVFGPEHAFSFSVREELAQQLGRTGDPAGAQLAYRELLADLERVLSPGHPMLRRVQDSASGHGIRI
jgi:tetratricopeptide (TPR) repeat protein